MLRNGPGEINRDSLLARTDSRLKLVGALSLILVLTALQQIMIILALDLFLICIAFSLGRLTVKQYLSAFARILPFALIVILPLVFWVPGNVIGGISTPVGRLTLTQEGLIRSAIIGLRFWGAATIGITVISTTSWEKTLWALRRLGVPGLILEIIQFTGRYGTLLVEEMENLRRAQRNRGFVMGKNLWNRETVRAVGQVLGVLVIRSYDRAERVYRAMLARGYTGEIYLLEERSLTVGQFGSAGLLLLFSLVMILFDRGLLL